MSGIYSLSSTKTAILLNENHTNFLCRFTISAPSTYKFKIAKSDDDDTEGAEQEWKTVSGMYKGEVESKTGTYEPHMLILKSVSNVFSEAKVNITCHSLPDQEEITTDAPDYYDETQYHREDNSSRKKEETNVYYLGGLAALIFLVIILLLSSKKK